MYRLISLVSFLLCFVLSRAQDTPQSVRPAFIDASLLPNVLHSFNPVFLLDTTYTVPETGLPKAVSPPGRNFTMQETLNRPTWSIPSTDPGLARETFVVAMVDPDAPTPLDTNEAQIRHFLGGRFRLAGPPSSQGAGTQLVNDTPALSDYLQPSPPETSDPHRYVFLLYREPDGFPTTISLNITHFNISAFADEFDLGEPLAGHFLTVSTKPS